MRFNCVRVIWVIHSYGSYESYGILKQKNVYLFLDQNAILLSVQSKGAFVKSAVFRASYSTLIIKQEYNDWVKGHSKSGKCTIS